jgi:hypothetical protein
MSRIVKCGSWIAVTGLVLTGFPANVAQGQPQMAVGAGMNPGQFAGGAGRIMSTPAGAGVGGLQNGMQGFNPYFPGAGDYNAWAGGTLTGAANLVGAQGQIMVSQQQAFLARENVRAEKIANKRRAFDEYLYEKEHTPTAEELRQQAQKEYLARARNNPPPVEIWSGTALNTILQDLRKNLGQPNAPSANSSMGLDPDMLKQINVTSGRGDGNPGLLKDDGKLTWPDALSDPEYKDERERVSSLMNEAVKQAGFNGQVDRGTVSQLQKDADTLGRMLRKNVDNVDVNSYIEAKGFLSNLDSTITILKQRDVGSFVNGKYTLKARNVDELVRFMADKGLTFAAAAPGQESAYNSLYNAMANYDTALQAIANKQ